jgi:hypothetical protein
MSLKSDENFSMGSRQESELMEQLRRVEESEARDRWKNIVHFCRKVGSAFLRSEVRRHLEFSC